MKNIRVAILSYSNVALFEMACGVELFGLARPEFESWYLCDVITFESQALATTGGLMMQATQVKDLANYDMLVVPSWPVDEPCVPQVISDSIIAFHRAGKRVVSFCSGAFLLAQLGLFERRDTTTHWRYAQKFKHRFPTLNYLDDVLYIYDGNVGCSAGSASGIDLGLEIIRQDFGYDIANQVARRLVVSAHRLGGQSQFVETPMLAVPNHFSAAIDWAMNNLSTDINVNDLAAHASMSRRTFDRKFRSSFNLSPKIWLIQQRLEKAKELLETQPFSIEIVAQMSGFDNATTMRHHFRKRLSISPIQYRQQFTAG